jgi:hypothetical protein
MSVTQAADDRLPVRGGRLVRLLYVFCLLAAGSAACGQPGPDDAVITLNGFCSHASRQGDSCQTVVTRAQFEKLTEALQPGMPSELRLKVANAYARMMKMAAAAEERGLDKMPGFAEEMRYARLQLLSQDLSRVLREDADNPTDAEIDAYYQKNRSSFEQAALARIFVPRARRGATHSEDRMVQVAADLRARAARGADPDELEIEACAAAGIPGSAPHTRLENVRRTTLPPTHEKVMDLEPGEVSEVLSDPGGGHFIYKMMSRSMLSLQQARPEIRRQLADEHYRQAARHFSDDVVFNDTYFAPATTPNRLQRERPVGPTVP